MSLSFAHYPPGIGVFLWAAKRPNSRRSGPLAALPKEDIGSGDHRSLLLALTLPRRWNRWVAQRTGSFSVTARNRIFVPNHAFR